MASQTVAHPENLTKPLSANENMTAQPQQPPSLAQHYHSTHGADSQQFSNSLQYDEKDENNSLNTAWLVYFVDNEYIIQTEELSDEQKLMTLETKEDDAYSWAVFKIKKIKNNYGLKTAGYWEIIEKVADDERNAKMAKSQSNEVNNETSTVTKRRKRKFQYVPLEHLKLIFELMQSHYHWSIQSQIEKTDFEKTHENILSTPFYLRYCGTDDYMKKEWDRIIIDGSLYILVWWNNVEGNSCNAFTVMVGEDAREYHYLRFRNEYTNLTWYVYYMIPDSEISILNMIGVC